MTVTPYISLVGSGQFGLSNAIDCHIYLLHTPEAAVLIDAGAGLEPERIVGNVTAVVERERVKAILLTHAHSDHAGGAAALSSAFHCPVYAAEPEARLVREATDEELALDVAKGSGVYPDDYVYFHTEVQGVEDGEALSFGDLTLRAIVTPGHSVASTSWLYERESGRDLFCGDTCFARGSIGLLNCAGSSLAAYREHFPRLAALDIDGFYPGHFVFAVTGGQQHLDAAREALDGLYVPECF